MYQHTLEEELQHTDNLDDIKMILLQANKLFQMVQDMSYVINKGGNQYLMDQVINNKRRK